MAYSFVSDSLGSDLGLGIKGGMREADEDKEPSS